MTPLVINERLHGEVVVLELDGRIVVGEGSRLLHTEVARLLNRGQRKIILDLGAVTHLDSSGIGELVSRHTTTSNAGGRLVLNRLPRKIHDLLRVTRLVNIFEVYDDEDDALRSFGQSGNLRES